MKDRLITLGLALGAFILFYALFVPKPAPEDKTTALPLSTETKPDGYQALWRWLEAQHIPALSFRDHYDHLVKRSEAYAGNVLIATLPQQTPAHANEMEQLDHWVQQGNTLLVIAALDDTPAWALGSEEDFISGLQRMTRVKFRATDERKKSGGDKDDAQSSSSSTDEDSADEQSGDDVDKEADSQSSSAQSAKQSSSAPSLLQTFDKLINPEHSYIEPNGTHPLFAGVQSVAAISAFPASRWRASNMDVSALLVLGKRNDAESQQQQASATLWLKRQGAGQIIICAFASPFTNQLIGEADNARLFANIIAWSRSVNGAVIFDDAHQGLVSYYDAKAFFADARLHRTLGWLVLLWLVFVLGWQRFRPQFDAWKPVDVTTFIKVTGGFFASSLTTSAVGQRMFEHLFNRIRRQLALPEDGQPAWDWLSQQAGISAAQLHDLQRLYDSVLRGKRVDLVQLQNRLHVATQHLA